MRLAALGGIVHWILSVWNMGVVSNIIVVLEQTW